MIDLFSLWLGGFLLAMVMNCIIVKELRKEFQNGPVTLVLTAVLWPLMAAVVLWCLIRDN